MLIQIISLGCNWWGRPGSNPDDPYRFTRSAAFYNSTGVRCGRKVRRHWIVQGLIRFNGASDFNPQCPLTCLGRTFSSPGITIWKGANRLLLSNSVLGKRPDFCLVTLSSDEHGVIDYSLPEWKSNQTKPIAISHLRKQQEAMFLMNHGDWVKTSCGVWSLLKSSGDGSLPILQLLIS